MQTFKNDKDIFFNKRPLTPQEWAKNPTVEFTISKDNIVHPGDRIHCCTTMLTTGPNSGAVKDIFYYLDEILDYRPSLVHPSMQTVITAKVSRKEL